MLLIPSLKSILKTFLQKEDLNSYPVKVHITETVAIVDHQEHR